MPRPNGPQWDAFGPEPIQSQAFMTINRVADSSTDDWHSGVMNPQDTKKVMRAANIRLWPLKDHASMQREGWTEYESTVHPHETLHTTQTYLHAPTIRKYMTEGSPETDPEYNDRPYNPEILTTERGTRWIGEGHHRLVASRLNKEWSRDVYEGPLLKY